MPLKNAEIEIFGIERGQLANLHMHHQSIHRSTHRHNNILNVSPA